MIEKPGLRVLIAEDQAWTRVDLRQILEQEGHTVVGEATDGAEAVALASTLEPDVVFMDIQMPYVDGIQAAAFITDRRIAAVVMVTAFDEATLVARSATAGAMGYVVKPFARKDIVPAMHVAVARFADVDRLMDELYDVTERLETRKVLDRAKGVLMAGGLSEPEAFRRLRKLAMDKRRTLREVAEAVITAPSSDDGVATPASSD